MWFADSAPTDHSVPLLLLLHNSFASLMNVFLVISDQGGVPYKLSHSTVFPFSLSLCVSVCVQMWLMWKVATKKSLCTCIYHAAVHAARCGFVLCSWYMTLHVQMHACVHWTKCEQPACVCGGERERGRDRVCVRVHVCEADVLCSVLFHRLVGLCCCSLVQTGLATCFSVCQDKPRLHRFNLSIAGAKSCP